VEGVVAEFAARYRSVGFVGSPLVPGEVTALERHLGLSLPAAYRAHLLLSGAAPPPVLVGADCYGHYLYKLRGWADELLAECGRPFALPADAVVFLMDQGYQFLYFQAGDGADDPPVWYFTEGMTAPEKRFDRFSAWVEACVAGWPVR
jgi:hypothetical protein